MISLNQMKNVHEFDGLLKNKYTPSKIFSKEEKIKLDDKNDDKTN